jgi:hypothetical protein
MQVTSISTQTDNNVLLVFKISQRKKLSTERDTQLLTDAVSQSWSAVLFEQPQHVSGTSQVRNTTVLIFHRVIKRWQPHTLQCISLTNLKLYIPCMIKILFTYIPTMLHITILVEIVKPYICFGSS